MDLKEKIEEQIEYHQSWPLVNCTPQDYQLVDKGWIEALEWVLQTIKNGQ